MNPVPVPPSDQPGAAAAAPAVPAAGPAAAVLPQRWMPSAWRLSLPWALLLLCLCASAMAGGLAFLLVAGLAVAETTAAAAAAALALLVVALPVSAAVIKLSPQPVAAGGAGALVDGSTGAATQAQFLDLAEREWARARRYGSGAALLLIDIDRFSRLNETHGNAAGEAVLLELARQTTPTLRGADALARFGPSQIAIFLAQADPTGALDVAERIRERTEQCDLPCHPQRLRVTVSVGVAQLRPAHLNLQALIVDAEDAVLAARQSGGNCVRAAPVEVGRLPTDGASRNGHRARPQSPQ